MPKKTERGPFGIFQQPFCRKTSKKLKGDPLGNFFSKKSLTVPKQTERGDPLVSPGMVCYAEKEEKPFWFSSLGQMSQFGTIKLCRTLKNYSGQFVWIEKKVTIIVAFHFMQRRLKTRQKTSKTSRINAFLFYKAPNKYHVTAIVT